MKKSQNWGQTCPNPNCNYYGKNSQENIRSVASYMTRSGKRRIFQCKVCGEMFSETRDTVFYFTETIKSSKSQLYFMMERNLMVNFYYAIIS